MTARTALLPSLRSSRPRAGHRTLPFAPNPIERIGVKRNQRVLLLRRWRGGYVSTPAWGIPATEAEASDLTGRTHQTAEASWKEK